MKFLHVRAALAAALFFGQGYGAFLGPNYQTPREDNAPRQATLPQPDLDLLQWFVTDSVPEVNGTYDDIRWPILPGNLSSLTFISDENALVFRGHFVSKQSSITISLEILGGPGFASMVWLDQQFLGSYDANPNVTTTTLTYAVTDVELAVEHILTVVIDTKGGAAALPQRGITNVSITYGTVAATATEAAEAVGEAVATATEATGQAVADATEAVQEAAASASQAAASASQAVAEAAANATSAVVEAAEGAAASPTTAADKGKRGITHLSPLHPFPRRKSRRQDDGISVTWKFAGYRPQDSTELVPAGLFYQRQGCVAHPAYCRTYLEAVSPFDQRHNTNPGIWFYVARFRAPMAGSRQLLPFTFVLGPAGSKPQSAIATAANAAAAAEVLSETSGTAAAGAASRALVAREDTVPEQGAMRVKLYLNGVRIGSYRSSDGVSKFPVTVAQLKKGYNMISLAVESMDPRGASFDLWAEAGLASGKAVKKAKHDGSYRSENYAPQAARLDG